MKPKTNAMAFFKSDLARNFTIGFVLGTCLVGVSAGPEIWDEVIPQAIAAPVE